MLMFRSDNVGEGGLGGGVGGSSTRKAHPIFKGAKLGDGTSTETATGGGWSLFMCNVNLNDSDPRFRPPICSTFVGFAITAAGVAALVLRGYSIALAAGVVITAIGVAILIFSFIWLFVTRQKILRTLEMKAAGLALEDAENKLKSKLAHSYPVDPIMTRGLVTIYYKSCEDTLPYGSGRLPSGTKAVRVPPSDGFMPVESSCFQLISTKGDGKNANKNYVNTRTPSTGTSTSPDRRMSKGRTLPARPSMDKINETSKNGSRDHRIRFAQKHKSGSDADQRPHPKLRPTLSDSDKEPQGRLGFVGDRSKPERQPMLNTHSNVHRTDYQPGRRPK